jgi:hypothetical protein
MTALPTTILACEIQHAIHNGETDHEQQEHAPNMRRGVGLLHQGMTAIFPLTAPLECPVFSLSAKIQALASFESTICFKSPAGDLTIWIKEGYWFSHHCSIYVMVNVQ